MKKLLVLIMLILSCTGCWNYKELTEFGIISAMAITYEDNKYIVYNQIINTVEGGENGITESPITVIAGEGETIIEAVREANLKTSKVFFPSNMEYVFLDQNVIKDHLEETLDFFARNTKTSLNFLVVTSTTNKAEDILSSLSKLDLNSASNLTDIIKRSESRYGASYALTMKELLDNYLSYGVTSVYPNIYIVGETDEGEDIESLQKSDSESYVMVKDLVAFDKNGEVITLLTPESFGYNFLQNHAGNSIISGKCDDSYFSIETLKSKIGYEDNLKKDSINVKGKIEAEVVFFGCKGDLNDTKTLKRIESISKKVIEEYVSKSVNLAIDKRTDFIGIGNYIYRNNNKYFDFKKNDWNEEGLPNLNFTYDIEVKLKKQGNLKGDVSNE